MNRNEAMQRTRMFDNLRSLGFTQDEAEALRRISMTLRRWFEWECGDNGWTVERDEAGKTFLVHYDSALANGVCRYPTPDRETGARKRLKRIIADRNMRTVSATPEPDTINGCAAKVADVSLSAFVQTDPRGAALYILRPGDVPAGEDISAYYSRGICVY